MESRGIVTLAGGSLYFLNAYINCRLLRDMGCALPVEWFHLGQEMTPTYKELVQEIPGVTLVDLTDDAPAQDYSKERGGWQNKVTAIQQSSFEDILWLDADCFPLRDPAYLFDHELFRTAACVFFPDPFLWNDYQLQHLKQRFGVELPPRQIESGQMMFRKSQCLAALAYTQELNANSADVYKYVFGDKDTFMLGAVATGTNYRISPHPHRDVPGGMLHKDFDGRDLLLHLTGAKWRWHGRAFMQVTDYPWQQRAMSLITKLKHRLKQPASPV